MSWNRFKENYYTNAGLGFSLDISRIPFPADFLGKMEPAMQAAFRAMTELEGGAIANPDEKRMVGHFWLRAPGLAPNPEIEEAIVRAVAEAFGGQLRFGRTQGGFRAALELPASGGQGR